MLTVDPVRLAKRQLDIDAERTARFTQLRAHKADRMMSSPLGLLRGSAPLFYWLLERHPALAEGPAGEGWLCGDAHLENFGAYRAGALSVREGKSPRHADRVVFDLNDFDDAFVGPWRLDVLRLLTSLVLGGREVGADGPRTLALCDALVEAYVGAVFRRPSPPPVPRAVSSLVEQVQGRTRKQLLDARTEIARGKRRFVRGPRYTELPDKLRAKSERAFAKYAKRLSDSDRPPDGALEVLDAAFRIAGTGSLGCLRVAVLVRGKGGDDGAWIFDMKEEGTPSSACLVPAPHLAPAERVREAIDRCLAKPPRMCGVTRLRGASMFVRRLAPQEDKLDLAKLQPADLEPLAKHLGALLGAAHRRGATRPPKKAWSQEDCRGVLVNALTMAGVHEAVYLAYCHLVRSERLVVRGRGRPGRG